VAPGSVIAIGRRAGALLQSSAEARVLAPLAASVYVVARGEIAWLCGPEAPLHPRAIVLSSAPRTDAYRAGDVLALPACTLPAWSPAPAATDPRTAAALRHGAARLAAAAAALGEPAGFGARLLGKPLQFPLTRAAGRADDLAAACAADDPSAAAAAALGLLGLGPGLTPSGDDFVGGAFFARARLVRADVGDAPGWRAAAEAVRVAAAWATHPVSAALLGDLLDGEAWAPLHALCDALAGADDGAARAAARRLVGLGHSSGWDVLAGLVAGAAR
jgi:hypothetical protein